MIADQLTVQRNQIGSTGAGALAGALPDASLEQLILVENHIGEDGAAAFCANLAKAH